MPAYGDKKSLGSIELEYVQPSWNVSEFVQNDQVQTQPT